jgi:arabinose-5-phosphate isomerase
MTDNQFDYLLIAKKVIEDEADALRKSIDLLGDGFVKACNWIRACEGRIIWIGVGQSWHVARKTACSMASLGKPSFYIHATEAVHGDMGLITKNDIVILISHSGKTKEVMDTLGPINRIGARTIALVGNPNSPLATSCDLALTTGVKEEAGPIKFAPSSSALVTTGIGDALVMAVAESIGFDESAYSRYHPGGAIGETLRGNKGD